MLDDRVHFPNFLNQGKAVAEGKISTVLAVDGKFYARLKVIRL